MSRAMRSPEEVYELLRNTLDNVKPSGDGKGFTARCPTHDDQQNSLSVTLSDQGVLLVHCFAGCRTPDVLMSCGVLMSECFPKGYEPSKPQTPREIVRIHSYQDENGEELFQAVKYDDGKWRQRHRGKDGEWVYSLHGVRRVLYRLPQLLAATPDKWVLLPEGEKDVDTLQAAGFVATTNPSGAKNWRKEFSETLRGRKVLILYDNDEPGRQRAKSLLEELKGVAKDVRILDLPNQPLGGGDVTDWLGEGHTVDELRELVQKATAGEIESNIDDATVFEEQMLKTIGLVVLGHLENGKVKVFSLHHRRSHVVELNRLGYAGILQICGPEAKNHVVPSQSSDPGLCTVSQVRNAIALMSGFRKADREHELGIGCWLGRDEDGHEDGTLLLVNVGEAAIWKDGSLKRLSVPLYKDQILNFTGETPWYEYDEIRGLLDNYSTDWAVGVLEEAEAVLRRWRWDRQEVCPRLLTGMILATWVQTLWDWRPQVALLGESQSGKSTLLDYLRDIFWGLAVRTSHPSPAGIRQRIQFSGRVPLCDEHDSNKRKVEFLEMIRASGRGDVELKGTGGLQQGKAFLLRHIFWAAGITMPRDRAPDRNRFILVELLPAEKGEKGNLVLPPPEETRKLGQKLLAIAVRVVIEARELAKTLRTVRHEGVEGRVMESYAVPAAMLACAMGLDSDEAADLLKWLVPLEQIERESTTDADDLLADIFNAEIHVPGGKCLTASQLLARASWETDYAEILEGCGIKETELDAGPGRPRKDQDFDAVFIDPRKVKRRLLRLTQWADQNINDVLGRVPGARYCQKTLAYGRPRGYVIPLDALVSAGVWQGREGIEEEPDDDLEALF